MVPARDAVDVAPCVLPACMRAMHAGVSRIMKVMDWGEVADMVTFGEVSAEDADDPADVFLLLAPQNIVGNTIMTNLSDMVRSWQRRPGRGSSSAPPAVPSWQLGVCPPGETCSFGLVASSAHTGMTAQGGSAPCAVQCSRW